MKRFVPSVVALSMLLASPLALAMSEEAENTLRSIDYYKNGVDLKTRPFKDGDSDNSVGQALYQYETKLKTVQERLAKVPAADRKDPKYEAYAKWVAEFETTLKKWQGERAGNAQSLKNKAAAEEAYKTESREVSEGLGFVKEVRAGSYRYPLDADALLGKWKKAEKLTAFAAKCDKEFAAVDASSYYGRDKAENCKNAAEWRTVLVPFFETRIKENTKKLGDDVTAIVNRIKNGETVYDKVLVRLQKPADYVATLRTPYEALFTAMGKALPSDLFAPVETAARGYSAAVTAGQAKVSYKAGKFADAGVSNAVKAAFTARNVKVLKVSQTFGDWEIRKNDIGFPTHRIRDSVVLGQVAGETFCRVYEVTSSQQYAGGGRYTTNTMVDLRSEPDFKISACK